MFMVGRQHRGLALSRAPADPAESKNPGMYRNSRRENREVPHLPAQLIAGRDAQGRPRPQA